MNKRLKQSLEDWQSRGLLSMEQSQNILAYEQSKQTAPRLMLALTLLAVFSIVLGLISVVAANWEDIPSWVKLSSYFIAALSLSGFTIRWDQKPGIIREALLFASILLIIAGIGLIAQVFHLSSEPWRGLAFWSALAVIPMLRSQSWQTPLLWYSSFYAAWLSFLWGRSEGVILRLEAFSLCWLFLGMAASWRGSWMLSSAKRMLTLFLSLSYLLILFPWIFGVALAKSDQNRFYTLDLPLIVFFLGSWLFLIWKSRPAYSRVQLSIIGPIFVLVILRTVVSFSLKIDIDSRMFNAVETLLFILQLTLMGIFALQENQSRIFDALSLLMALRILVLFYTLFGSLLMTGTGLIGFGIFILVLLRLWFRNHQRIRLWLKGVLG